MSTSNRAAWTRTKNNSTLYIDEAPYTHPKSGQLVIQNGAVGINPFDWVLQHQGGILASHLTYPTVLGSDVAGCVVEVAPDVSQFAVGDRVAGIASCIAKESNEASEGAYQLYTVVRHNMIARLPDHVTNEQAATLGLGITTAAFGLFHADYLGLDMPQVPPPRNPQKGKTVPRAVIVTGGASNVGSCAVQLAVSAGYMVVSTSSPKNFSYVQSLGAAKVLDYNSKELVTGLVHSLEGYELAGAFTVGADADRVCAAVMKERLAKTPRLPTRKFIALAGGATRDPDSIQGLSGSLRLMGDFMTMMGKNAVKKVLTGIEVKFILLIGVLDPQSCVSRVYSDFLGLALAEKQFVPSPEPQIVGSGLSKIDEALEINKKGVSAKKVVVSLP